MSLDFATLRNLNAGHVGTSDVACPLCSGECRTAVNRKRKVLRIWDDGKFITFKCARCEASGWAKDSAASPARPRREARTSAEPNRDRAELAQWLWSHSLPLAGSLAETYLHSRSCFTASSSLRFLRGRGEHPPAMIARFGSGAVTGAHLTKLKADGSGKAGTDKDKIMIGPSVGQPIVVHDNPERGELLIAEGIEDAASLALATGWTAWAAGSAGRIASVLIGAAGFETVYLAIDRDRAGRQALERARAIRRDVIPLRLWRILPSKKSTDANRALIEFGPDALLAAIEWCEAQARHAQGSICFNQMQTAMARADGIFHAIAGDGAGI